MSTLNKKTIVITGAAMGLGFAAAREAASQGAHLALVDLNETALQEAKAMIVDSFPGYN
jgi:NAD(P)-dependent dehydrogenase (short-subunit alcohol dehydrogenase family)